MKKISSGYLYISLVLLLSVYIVGVSGCANIIPPSGGPKDTLPPVLVAATPKDSTINFKGNRITLTFNEYIEVQNQLENLVFSPLPNNIPVINSNLKTISIKIKDTLEPNTTYSINFGDAVRDVNESNVLKNFTYVFSTGDTLDDNSFTGRVVMAETGKVDSTLIVVLHRSLDDSAVVKEKPRYIAKLDGRGNFLFRHLPAGTFAVYALPNDFSKKYEDTTKPFAFADKPINTTENTPVTLYAYQLKRADTAAKPSEANKNVVKEKSVKYSTSLEVGRQDLLDSLKMTFSSKLISIDTSRFLLSDTFYRRYTNYRIITDTSGSAVTIVLPWTPNTPYKLVIQKDAVTDTGGNTLAKTDTISFKTKALEEYGSVKLRFNNIDYSKNPVLQVLQADKTIESSPLTQRDWVRKLYPPGEYDLRILYDSNKNGVWDPGKFFGQHIQPELAVLLDTKLSVRANWDNEKEITLQK